MKSAANDTQDQVQKDFAIFNPEAAASIRNVRFTCAP
jgi:hypothetical protein